MSIETVLQFCKNKNFAQARELLAPILAAEPNNEAALAIQMNIAATPSQRQRAFEQLSRINPNNPHVLKRQPKLTSDQLELVPIEPKPEQDDVAYEMQWDCQYCDMQNLLGKTHKFCPACGAAQDPLQRYFPDDNEKVAAKDHAYVGADKTCPSCRCANSANVSFCTSCGAALAEAKNVTLAEAEMRDMDTDFARSETINRQQRYDSRYIQEPENVKNWKLPIITLISLLMIASVVWLLFRTQTKTVIVNGFSWQRTVKIERYASRSKSGWCNQMPSDAYYISKSSKLRSHRKVSDGQECRRKRSDRGDGTYVEKQDCRTKYRDEPVYDDYCHYRIDRWEYMREVVAKGTDKSPYWPNYQLSRNCITSHLGCEREGQHLAAYTLTLYDANTGLNYVCSKNEAFWQAVQPASKWLLKVGKFFDDARCNSLQTV